MQNDSDNNYVSVGSWMWMMFVTAIPVVGFIMVLVWAFTGTNESRKNYFKAILTWVLVFVGFVVLLAMLGNLPAVLKNIQGWTHRT
jgi:hypothetical protein